MVLNRWDSMYSTEESNKILTALALLHLAQVSKACGLGPILTDYLLSGKHAELCGFELLYTETLTTSDALHIRQALAFFQKREDLDIGIDKEAAARKKFIASEGECLRTNRRFKSWASGDHKFSPDAERAFARAQRKIADTLGPLPSFEILLPHFGKGATTQVNKRDATPRRKLGEALCCSEDLIPLLPVLLREVTPWVLNQPGVASDEERDSAKATVSIESGHLSFVPKNAKTYRSIVVEPTLNGFFQLGIGDYMTKRLLANGVDLKDQSTNRRLARLGSLTGELATLDLSSASDTIATELVWHLLPLDWALLLSSLRTSTVWDGANHVRLHKFSSMGNGFTFPLESLIFWALGKAIVDDDGVVSVYGDDIIVPSKHAQRLVSVLQEAGFSVNREKSFITGPFRESCGGDYLSGIDIRPLYIKRRLLVADLFALHNFYVRNFDLEMANSVLPWIPQHLRVWGPDGYGDGHLIGDHELVPHKRDRGYGGFTFDTFTFKGRKDFRCTPGDHVLPCYSVYASEPSDFFEGEPSFSASFNRRRADSLKYGDRFGMWVDESDEAPRHIRLSGLTCAPETVTHYDSKGRLGTVVPGTNGYKRISIYILNRP